MWPQLFRFVCIVISLAADVRSYVSEHSSHEVKYRSVSASGSGADASDVRRAREFVDEATATLQDVRQRLQESWNNLSLFLAEMAVRNDVDVLADPCVAEARAMLAEVAPLVNVPVGAGAEENVRAIKVCVLGDSQLNEGQPQRSSVRQRDVRIGLRLALSCSILL